MNTLRKHSLRTSLIWGAMAILLLSCAPTPKEKAAEPEEKVDIDHQMGVAKAQYEKGNYQEAARSYQAVLSQNPDHVDALFKLGVIKYKQGFMTQSRSQFLRVIALAPTYSKAYYNLGAIYSTPGPSYNPEKAAFFFNKYLAIEPGSAHREKIERWLAGYGTPQKQTPVTKPPQPSPIPADPKDPADPDDLKQWLKQQADQMGATE